MEDVEEQKWRNHNQDILCEEKLFSIKENILKKKKKDIQTLQNNMITGISHADCAVLVFTFTVWYLQVWANP